MYSASSGPSSAGSMSPDCSPSLVIAAPGLSDHDAALGSTPSSSAVVSTAASNMNAEVTTLHVADISSFALNEHLQFVQGYSGIPTHETCRIMQFYIIFNSNI